MDLLGVGSPSKTPPGNDNAFSSLDMDTECTETSGVVTLKPFAPSVSSNKPLPQRNKHRGGGNRAVSHCNRIEVLPGVFESSDYSKYLTIKLDGEKRVQDLDMFIVHEEITNVTGRETKMMCQSDGCLLVEVTSSEESIKLQSLAILDGNNVKCCPHKTLNSCKGVIRSVELLKYSEERLQKEFQNQKVTEVKQMKRNSNGIITPLPVYVLTFDLLKLPPIIKAAWLRLQVRPYVPAPRRCYYCQRYGHVSNNCRRRIKGEKMICNTCGQEDHGECHNAPFCINCKESHPASSKKCDRYILEREIQTLRSKEQISFLEAKSKVLSQCIRPGVTFASVLNKSKKRTVTSAFNSFSVLNNQVNQTISKGQIYSSNTKRRRPSGDEHHKPTKIQSVSIPVTNKFDFLHDEADTADVLALSNNASCEKSQTSLNPVLVQADVHISASSSQQAETSPLEEILPNSKLPSSPGKEDEVSLPSLDGKDSLPPTSPSKLRQSESNSNSKSPLNSEEENKKSVTAKANLRQTDSKSLISRKIKVPVKKSKGLEKQEDTHKVKASVRKAPEKGSGKNKH